MAQPFDVERLALTGDAVALADGVPGGGVPTTAGFSAARGLLVHASGSTTSDLTWFDRTGNRIGALGEPGVFLSLNFIEGPPQPRRDLGGSRESEYVDRGRGPRSADAPDVQGQSGPYLFAGWPDGVLFVRSGQP